MRIGIVGSGNIGDTAAALFAEAGHEVMISNSRGPQSLTDELEEGVVAGTVEEACEFGEVVLVAIPLKAYRTLPAEALADKIVIDAMNYYPGRDGHIAELDSDETTSSELLARHLEHARVVKAFNTMYFATLREDGRPAGDPERLVLFTASDDRDAERTVADLIDEIGFDTVRTGSLAEGGRLQQPGSPIYNHPMTTGQAREALGTF